MKPEIKGYLLKEYGSWSVLIISFLVGIGTSRTFSWNVVPLFFALAFLINSKQAYTVWTRRRGQVNARALFLLQIGAATAILVLLFGRDIPMLLPLLVFPAAYLLMNRLAGEHAIVTELLGFALLSLAAVLAKFLLTGGLDVRLFLGVAFYFTAGVFKVKALLMKKMRDRVLMVLHAALSFYVYHRMYIPLVVLLPMIDNILVAVTLYKVRLRTTGWIEVVKSMAFLVLFLRYYY